VADSTYSVDAELKIEFVDESMDMLATLEDLFLELEAQPNDLEIVNGIFRPIHSIKGNSAFFNLMKVSALSHEMETVLDLVRSGKLAPTKPVTDVLLAGVDLLRSMLERARRDESEVADEERFQGLLELIKQAPEADGADKAHLWRRLFDGMDALKSRVTQGSAIDAEVLDDILAIAARLGPGVIAGESDPAHEQTKAEPSARGAENAPKSSADERTEQKRGKTMRVAEAHVDGFLDSVGELVVIGQMFRHLQRRISDNNVGRDVITQFRQVNWCATSPRPRTRRSPRLLREKMSRSTRV